MIDLHHEVGQACHQATTHRAGEHYLLAHESILIELGICGGDGIGGHGGGRAHKIQGVHQLPREVGIVKLFNGGFGQPGLDLICDHISDFIAIGPAEQYGGGHLLLPEPTVTAKSVGAAVLAGVVHEIEIAAGSYGTAIHCLAFDDAVVGREREQVIVFAIHHAILSVVTGRSTLFDAVDAFAGLGITHGPGDAAGECYGFEIARPTHIADGQDHVLHLFGIDDVLQAI